MDSYLTIAAPSSGEFKDRGSKFLAFAWPVSDESEALQHLEILKKSHFKANHHCFAWRIGLDGERFRAVDDGEPSGTAGRPILGQIDARGLTNVAVIVVRYFGGTLLGASGLIQAYREAAAAALSAATIEEKIIFARFVVSFDYALMPELMNALKKLDIRILKETFDERGTMEIGIRSGEASEKIRLLKAQLWQVTPDHADVLDWPAGMTVEVIESSNE